MAGHAKKCVERYCELANKTTQQLSKVSTPCTDDHHFKEEETKSVGELTNIRSQIVAQGHFLLEAVVAHARLLIAFVVCTLFWFGFLVSVHQYGSRCPKDG